MWHDHTFVKEGNKKSKAIKRAEGGRRWTKFEKRLGAKQYGEGLHKILG